jgi:hypothetical protein
MTQAPRIALSAADLAWVDRVARQRMRASGNVGRNPHRSVLRDDDERLRDERIGAAAELALAHYLDVPWQAFLNTFHRQPDVGRFDVRATWRVDGCLIVRDDDPPQRPVVFVTGDGTVMTLRGWAWTAECRRPAYLRNPRGRRPAWFVPVAALRPIPPRIAAAA